jgi:hypothetical protein
MKRRILLVALTLSISTLFAQNKFGTPRSIIHVVTVLWKEDSTPEQQQAAVDGVRKMAAAIPGIRNVWVKTLKVQGRGPAGKDGKPGRPYEAAFVIEFADQAAADRYVDHPAHLEWEKIYLPIREVSTSHQITN